MPFIQNISLEDCKNGNHLEAGPNSVLIQITDCDTPAPKPKEVFKEAYQFQFLDIEDNWITKHLEVEHMAISDEQAQKISEILKNALNQNANVIVHCHMGISRSGAVADVGVALGFSDTRTWRRPNMLVKHKLMKFLGLDFDPEEESKLVHAVEVDFVGKKYYLQTDD